MALYKHAFNCILSPNSSKVCSKLCKTRSQSQNFPTSQGGIPPQTPPCWCLYREKLSPQRSKFWLSVRPGQPKKSPDNQKYWCRCPTDNRSQDSPLYVYIYIFQVRTTKNLDGQAEIVTWLSVGQPFIFPKFKHCSPLFKSFRGPCNIRVCANCMIQ